MVFFFFVPFLFQMSFQRPPPRWRPGHTPLPGGAEMTFENNVWNHNSGSIFFFVSFCFSAP